MLAVWASSLMKRASPTIVAIHPLALLLRSWPRPRTLSHRTTLVGIGLAVVISCALAVVAPLCALPEAPTRALAERTVALARTGARDTKNAPRTTANRVRR